MTAAEKKKAKKKAREKAKKAGGDGEEAAAPAAAKKGGKKVSHCSLTDLPVSISGCLRACARDPAAWTWVYSLAPKHAVSATLQHMAINSNARGSQGDLEQKEHTTLALAYILPCSVSRLAVPWLSSQAVLYGNIYRLAPKHAVPATSNIWASSAMPEALK